jgi:thioredoxin reductase
MEKIYDVIIAGGGPAGLSAALLLGRSRRSVLVFDSGIYRNQASSSMNGFLTRDGTDPREFLKLAREELGKYGVEYIADRITTVAGKEGNFQVSLADKTMYTCKKLLLATGLTDQLPAVPGIEEFYGSHVFHCPYCDGWELDMRPVAVLAARSKAAVAFSRKMLNWSRQVTLLTSYCGRMDEGEQAELRANGIVLNPGNIVALSRSRENLLLLEFDNGERLGVGGLFFSIPCVQRSTLAAQLQCRITGDGAIKVDRHQETTVKGVYAAGDMVRDMQLVVIAAAEGARAAVNINNALSGE